MARRIRTASTTHLTVAEAAERLRVCPDTVRAAIHRGELPAVRIGRTIRIPLAALDGTPTTEAAAA